MENEYEMDAYQQGLSYLEQVRIASKKLQQAKIQSKKENKRGIKDLVKILKNNCRIENLTERQFCALRNQLMNIRVYFSTGSHISMRGSPTRYWIAIQEEELEYFQENKI